MLKIKVIELEDQFVEKSHEYPYIHSIKSKIRFRLRSKITFDHEPYLLIDRAASFEDVLPLKTYVDLHSQKIQAQLHVIKGELTDDGAWITDLPSLNAGVVNFQLVFTRYGSSQVIKFGTCDVILLCQNKHQLIKLRKMSVFPRCIGTYDKWQDFFLSQQRLGYNSFHLAPIQETGASNSYYSLKNHLQYSNHVFKGTKQQKNKQLATILTNMKQKGMIFFIDIILNHTSFDSEWVKDAPDSVFTTQNTPFLHTAFLMDETIYHWGQQVKQMMGVDVQFTSEILIQIEENLLNRLLKLKIYEFFQISQNFIGKMLEIIQPRVPSENIFVKDPVQSIEIFLSSFSSLPNSQRQGRTLDLQAWKNLDLVFQQRDLIIALQKFNKDWTRKIESQWVPEIVKNTIGSVKYHYFDNEIRKFDDKFPLVQKYFSLIKGKKGDFYAINNGWVGDADSRDMFVLSKQYYYLRRRVNVWGDLLRIRYGQKPEDSPTAWKHMLQYIREMAKYFDGFRMDNLHGTQLKVAKHMIQQARKVNPNLIVFAQLFTSSEQQTATFVKKVGINSVLKEAQHLLSGELFIQQFHKKLQLTKPYLGSLNNYFIENNQLVKYSGKKKPIVLIYDLTHDNQTYIDQGMIVLQTPVSLALSMMGTFVGSTKGYDQFYTHKVQVTQMDDIYRKDPIYPPIEEKSQICAYKFVSKVACSIYGSWDSWNIEHKLILHEQSEKYELTLYLPVGLYQYKYKDDEEWIIDAEKEVNKNSNHEFTVKSNMKGKRLYRNLQNLRYETHVFAEKYTNYKEYHAFHIGNVVIVIRESEDHLNSVCMIANLSKTEEVLKVPIQLVGNISTASIWLQSDLSLYEGLTTQSEIAHSKNIHEFFDVKLNKSTGYDILESTSLPPGFGCILQCRKNDCQQQVIREMNQLINRKIELPPLGPIEYNILLFGCAEEQEVIYGQSNYSIPQSNFKQLVYAGLGGIYYILLKAKRERKLEEGLFANLREGNWLFNYYLYRLKKHKTLNVMTQYLEGVFNLIQRLPRYLIPKYFTDFVYNLMITIEEHISGGIDFKKKLVLASTQFINYFPNCPLSFKILFSAGLPHFSVGWSRCWGRDTFTCSDLLLLYPNIFKETILQFASAYRHGLIPNLLDQGKRPRYNSRDACWWFIRSISQYIDQTEDYSILKSKVRMIFLSDDLYEHNRLKQEGKERILLLEEVVQAIFQAHTEGISFRQWNAGYEIDSNMNTEGFNIHIQAKEDNGFLFGGNAYNCLTWMDKMGSSQKANTKGVPSTSRTGSPIEIIGLLYNCLIKFSKLYQQGHFFKQGFVFENKFIKYKDWAQNIMSSFQPSYFIPESQSQSSYIKGIYKDVYGSKLQYDQSRFRPNVLVAIAISPELFNLSNAKLYISKVETHLLGPKSIGVSTLADNHLIYVPYYDNADDSHDPKLAHGYSYHNGPQWVWLYGFYLVAKINVNEGKVNKKRMMSLLQEHIKYIQANEWLSLPEITNKNGEYNNYSCHAQAWSISSILMALKHIERLQE